MIIKTLYDYQKSSLPAYDEVCSSSYISKMVNYYNNNKYAYPRQFSIPRNISNPCSAPLCAGEW